MWNASVEVVRPTTHVRSLGRKSNHRYQLLTGDHRSNTNITLTHTGDVMHRSLLQYKRDMQCIEV